MRAFRPQILLVASIALLLTAALAFPIRADEGERLLSASLAPSKPTDPAFHGVTPGGVPWVLSEGRARVGADGELELRVEGLIIPALGNAGAVKTVSASLFCGADATTAPAATTQPVPLTPDGNARIEEHVSVPATCLAPIVMLHPNGAAARYIAITGARP